MAERTHYKKIRLSREKTVDHHRHIASITFNKTLGFNDVVHHKDGNKLNNDPDNLEIMSRSEHSRMHMPKGRKLTQETIEKIRANSIKNCKNRKFSEAAVKHIKELLSAGFKGSSIARLFKVDKKTISSIKLGQTYKWVK